MLITTRATAAANVQTRMPHHAGYHGMIKPLDHANQPDFLFTHLAWQPDVGQHGHQRQRQNQGTGQGKQHGQSHRFEQFSLRSFQRQDGKVDNRDDQFAEHGRLADFDRRVANDMHVRPPLFVQ